jgi:rhodanese-related sulfurtransferase
MATPGRLLVPSKAAFDALLRPPMVEEPDAAAAREMIARGAALLLDGRQPTGHEGSRIPGAPSLPSRSRAP